MGGCSYHKASSAVGSGHLCRCKHLPDSRICGLWNMSKKTLYVVSQQQNYEVKFVVNQVAYVSGFKREGKAGKRESDMHAINQAEHENK